MLDIFGQFSAISVLGIIKFFFVISELLLGRCFRNHKRNFFLIIHVDFDLSRILERYLDTFVHQLQLDTFIQQKKNVATTDNTLYGYFCPKTIFNWRNRVLTDTKINVLEKGLDFAAIQKKMNEPELRSDFNEFCRRMRLKWNFRDESENFSKVSVFNPKSRW